MSLPQIFKSAQKTVSLTKILNGLEWWQKALKINSELKIITFWEKERQRWYEIELDKNT